MTAQLRTGVVVLAACLCAAVAHGANLTSAGSGFWDVSGTWSPAQVPAAGDFVTIAAGHTVTIRWDRTTGRPDPGEFTWMFRVT